MSIEAPRRGSDRAIGFGILCRQRRRRLLDIQRLHQRRRPPGDRRRRAPDDRPGHRIGSGVDRVAVLRREGRLKSAAGGHRARNNIAAQTPARRTQRAIAVFTAGSIMVFSIDARPVRRKRFSADKTSCRRAWSAPAECGEHTAFSMRRKRWGNDRRAVADKPSPFPRPLRGDCSPTRYFGCVEPSRTREIRPTVADPWASVIAERRPPRFAARWGKHSCLPRAMRHLWQTNVCPADTWRSVDQLSIGRQQLPGAEPYDRENYVQHEADHECGHRRHGDVVLIVGQVGKACCGPVPLQQQRHHEVERADDEPDDPGDPARRVETRPSGRTIFGRPSGNRPASRRRRARTKPRSPRKR